MSYNPDNIFAKIIKGDLPCHKVYEDDKTFAFLDIMPRAKGHTLVIPKAGAENMFDIGLDDFTALTTTVHKLTPLIKGAFNADGILLQQLNGDAAGQLVYHIHFHIVPRFNDVPLKHHSNQMAQDDILKSNAKIITDHIQKHG